MKKIALLGSTGSIGLSTLEVVRRAKNEMQIKVLAARSNIELLEKQAKEFSPSLVAVYDDEAANELKKRLPNIRVVSGMKGLIEAATLEEVNFVMQAMSGNLGLQPTLSAIQNNKTIGLANKEVLVSAGDLICENIKKYNTTLLPVDSEHSALFQCLNGEDKKRVKRLILTASGGPFYFYQDHELERITVKDALNHPNWKMGPKITIDSSTLMNKGFEVIEAHYLFDIPIEQIEVVIHPESIIHSMVEFVDGSVMAQASPPDMKLPIQYALTYPDRMPSGCKTMDFTKAFSLRFFPPDIQKFPCLGLAYQALRQKENVPLTLNAVNDVLVQRFMQGEISWADIGKKLSKILSSHQARDVLTLQEILADDEKARRLALTV